MRRNPGGPRLATLTIPAPDLGPEVFLRDAAGEARGFWARGDRWVAHRGVLAELTCSADAERDRFEAVADAARDLSVEPLLPSGAARASRVRFYGGFSFREDHRAAGVWSAFPSCLFHVPMIELEGDGSGDAWLRARGLGRPEEAGELFPRLRHRAEAIRAELTAQGERRDGGTPVGERARGRCVSTDRAHWERAVDEALDAVRSGAVTKVVLARTMDVELDRPLDPVDVAMKLWQANHGSHVFLFEPVPECALVGAAPETVATLRDGVFHATAVAGSIRGGSTARERAELAAKLLASEKDRVEQRIALDDVVARLETLTHQIRADPQPHVLTLPAIQHLETEIRASVPSGTGVLDLLRLLHPTPAVCGLPRDAALSFLAEEEPFERGWYAGPVGWFDADGNGVFAPALRSGVSTGSGWRLFAGAGIVKGSVPALEWEETAIKLEPVLDALRASGAELVTGGRPSGTAEASTREHA